jgi:hypothetical protein
MNSSWISARRLAARSLVSLLAAGLAHSATAQQQQSGKIIGARLRTPEPFNLVRIPAAQKTAVTETMQKLYDVVRRDTMYYERVWVDVLRSQRI